MTDAIGIGRRTLLMSGAAASTLTMLPFAAQARMSAGPTDPGDTGAANTTALAPREQLLFDFDWRFTFGHGTDPAKDLGFGFGQADFSKTGQFDFAKVGYDVSTWRHLNLPHDWGVELPFVHDDAGQGDNQSRSHGYKPLGRRYPQTSVGWYRREFDIPDADAGRRIWIEFDGAFRDVLVFVNGCFIGRSDSGYVPFRFDVTDFLAYGAKNAIAVRVDASAGEGWFYEGAGLYRHVWMLKTNALHLERWENVVRASPDGDTGRLSLSAIATNTSSVDRPATVFWDILDPDGKTVTRVESPVQTVPAGGSLVFRGEGQVDRARAWSIESPHLYGAHATLSCAGATVDGERVDFGIRNVVFDAGKGFFLNGKNLKIQGVCNHQDHAGVGSALPDRLQAYRLSVMQAMGCNAIRTSHNMPTPELVAACDRMGMMVMCETRQMSASPEGLSQLANMVKRYRNSPSVILWSIGNEENQLQGPMAEQGARIGATMVRTCHELDPTRLVTAAVNADNRKGVSNAVDVVGFNYHLDFPDAFHRDNPTRPIMASETSSAVSTRGEYETDWKRNVVDSYHGTYELPELWWQFYAQREWAAGGFAWTGFDYRGEPSPFGWPSANSNFGIVDLCGFPKDYFYYYKAWWTRAPVLHVFPHWNWPGREDSEIKVWVYSNLDEVELLVNGRSLGRQAVPPLGHLEWKAIYTPGAMEARGFKGGKRVLTERRETTGAPKAIRLRADRAAINADGEDVAIVTVDVLDDKGRAVPTANNRLAFRVSGPGQLIGVGNGNPNCLESDKGSTRSLFNGLAQLVVQASKSPGDIIVEAVGIGEEKPLPSRFIIPALPCGPRASVS